MAKKKAKKKTVRKQSSSRLSTLASHWLARAIAETQDTVNVPAKDLKALCASVLSQDETRGQKR